MTWVKSLLAAARDRVTQCGDSLEARLVYADVLSERGDVRGLFIIAQCSGDEATAAELLKHHRAQLLRPLPQLVDVQFRNGFIESWTTTALGLRRWGRKMLRSTLLRKLSVTSARVEDLQLTIRAPGFEHVRELELIRPWAGSLYWLASVKPLPGLRTLRVVGLCSAGERQALLESTLRTGLDTLEFTALRSKESAVDSGRA